MALVIARKAIFVVREIEQENRKSVYRARMRVHPFMTHGFPMVTTGG